MVSVASGQIASIGIPAYQAANNDGGTAPLDPGKLEDQMSPVQAAFNRHEGAVQLSLSPAALDHLAAANRMAERLGVTLKDGQSPEEAAQQYFDDKSAQGKLRVEIGMLNVKINFQARAKDDLGQNQAEYNRILKTKPVPRKELAGPEKDAALKLLENLGYAHPGKNQSRMFSVDGTMYTFKGDDGSVWTNDGNIPISEDAKQLTLGHLSSRISEGQRDISDVISNRDALQAQYDALAAKYAPRAKQE
jgi:hypothetical protein